MWVGLSLKSPFIYHPFFKLYGNFRKKHCWKFEEIVEKKSYLLLIFKKIEKKHVFLYVSFASIFKYTTWVSLYGNMYTGHECHIWLKFFLFSPWHIRYCANLKFKLLDLERCILKTCWWLGWVKASPMRTISQMGLHGFIKVA